MKLKTSRFAISFTVLILFFSCSLFAQKTVSGKVTDQAKNPIVGVSISVKGSPGGTLTGNTGEFTLHVPSDNSILQISYVGYVSQQLSVSGRTNVGTISLVAQNNTLNEVVVTGYSTQRTRDVTGSIATVKGENLATIPSGNAEQQLQGKVSGVTVTTSGQPGSSSSVRIRGIGSFLDNDPLYVVDGLQTTDISYINPDDIETMTVLKDAAAASIYGSRAFAGVILVTTKKGTSSGKLHVDYHVSYGWQDPGNGFKLLNPQQTADWTWKAYQNAGEDPASSAQSAQYGTGTTPVLPDYIMAGNKYGLKEGDPAIDLSQYNVDYSKGSIYQVVKANKAGTNWYKEVTQVAPIMDQHVGLSGGSDNAKFYIGLGYYDQQGVVIETYLKKYTLRANTEFNIKNRVKIGEDLQVSLMDNPQIYAGNQNEGNSISFSYRENPLIPVHDVKGGWAGSAAAGFNNPQNPVADQTLSKNNRSLTPYSVGDVYATVTLPFHLSFKSTFAGYYWNNYYRTFSYRTYWNKENTGSDVDYEGASTGYGYNFSNVLTFDNKFGDHNVKVLVGEEALNSDYRSLSAQGYNPFSTNVSYSNINTTQSGGRVVSDGGGPGATFFSLFGQVNYNYKDKYLVAGTIRRDGASVFGPEEKYGVFPAASVGWRLSEENFMKGITWINDLKLRGSYGELGNAGAIPASNQYNTYGPNPQTASYDLNGTSNSIVEGFRANTFGVPQTHWETDKTLDVGLDATLFNHGFDIAFDWYKRTTVGLLYNPQVEATVGFLTSYPYINIASMRNTGIDLQLEKQGDINRDWHYDASVTFSHYKNEILKIADNTNYFYGNSYGSGRIGSPTINQVGEAVSAFYGYKVVGLWQSQKDIDAADAQAKTALNDTTATFQPGGEHPGEFRYADVNHNGYISDSDRTIIGNPNPDFTYGINLAVRYKNFDLKVEFYGVQGGNIFNYTKWFTDFFPSFPGGAISSRVLNSWTPTNTNTKVPIFEDVSSASTNLYANSYYVEPASYFRCRNIQLGYTVRKGSLLKAGIESLRFYVQAINPFTITKYDGLDPALDGINGNFGVDYGNYPFVKQYILGLNVGF